MLSVEHAGRLRVIQTAHGLHDAALGEGDDRRAAGLGLDRADAEILLGSEDKRPGATHVLQQYAAWLKTQQCHVAHLAGNGLRLGQVRPVANHDQVFVRHRGEGFDDHRHAFVRHHPRGAEVEVSARALGGEAERVHWRVDDGGVAPISLGNARSDKPGIGNEGIHAGRCALVPQANVMQDQARQTTLDALAQP